MKLLIPILSLSFLVVGLPSGVLGQETLLPEPREDEGTASEALVPDAPEPAAIETPVSETSDKPKVAKEMAIFQSHVGNWEGLTKMASTEKGTKTITNSRSEWSGGYLLGGHVFEIRGYSYGELGRIQYRWQYSYDVLKERYMSSYYDSNGRTHFCEGKVNQEKTKIIWRLLAPPGDMTWHVETDLEAENGIEVNGRVGSKEFEYDMVYTSVFKRS